MVDVDKIFDKVQESYDKKNYDYAADLSKQVLDFKPDHANARTILRSSTIKSYEIKGGVPTGFKAVLSGFIPMTKMFFYGIFGKKTIDVANTCELYLAKNPMSIWGRYRLASVLQNMGYVDSAIQEFEGLVNLKLNHVNALKALGELHKEKKDIKTAMNYYRQVFALNPSDLDTPRALKDLAALTTIEKGGWANARSSRDVIRDKDKAVALEKSSQTAKGSNVDSEIDRLREIVSQDSNNPKNLVSLKKIGELYIQKKDYKKAHDVYQEALKLTPSDATLSMRIGDIKLLSYDVELSKLQKELVKNSTDQNLRSKIVKIKTDRMKFKIEEYTRRVKAHPTDMGLHFQLGIALFLSGKTDEAIAEFQNSARDPKRRIQSYRYLGESFSRKKLYVVSGRASSQLCRKQ